MYRRRNIRKYGRYPRKYRPYRRYKGNIVPLIKSVINN